MENCKAHNARYRVVCGVLKRSRYFMGKRYEAKASRELLTIFQADLVWSGLFRSKIIMSLKNCVINRLNLMEKVGVGLEMNDV